MTRRTHVLLRAGSTAEPRGKRPSKSSQIINGSDRTPCHSQAGATTIPTEKPVACVGGGTQGPHTPQRLRGMHLLETEYSTFSRKTFQKTARAPAS